jgi:hypothetical protein
MKSGDVFSTPKDYNKYLEEVETLGSPPPSPIPETGNS